MLGVFRRRRLPHWDVPDATYFVTACLDGSIPAQGLGELDDYRRTLDGQPRPKGMSESDWEQHKDKLMFARWDAWLDGKPSVQHLAIPELAKCIQRSIYHFAEARYHVVAYAVMPSHLHWVFHPTPAWCEEIARITSRVARQRTPRELIMHSFKSFTAHECNLALQQTGAFWQAESYDHWARDHDELQRIIDYVEQNPVKARLAGVADSFVYSSAYDRKLWGIARGDPLIPPKDLLHPWAIPRLP